MKKCYVVASAAVLLAVAAVAFAANPYSDVPVGHWSYEAIESLYSKNIIKGYSDGAFQGNRPVSRYEMALTLSRLLANGEAKNENSKFSDDESKAINKLTAEFSEELALIGVKTISLEDNMQILRNNILKIRNELDAVKTEYPRVESSRIKLSGDILVRNTYAREKVEPRDSSSNRTSTQFRLQMDAKVDENVKAVARWLMIDDELYRSGVESWDGRSSRPTGKLDVAYLEVKDMFRFGGDFVFGRRNIFHGHNLLVNDRKDSVTYSKWCGDVNLSVNCFFDRDKNGNDYHNLWNVNLDGRLRGHDVYMGLYYKTLPAFVAPNDRNEKYYAVELGSDGDLGNNGFWAYDLGAVYQNTEDGKYEDPTRFTDKNGLVRTGDAKGFMAHGALKWDSKEEWAAKVAYTLVDEEACINHRDVDYDFRYEDAPENPFEDVMRGFIDGYAGANYNSISNTQDIKLQLVYSPKKNGKHYIRLAYDMLEAKKDTYRSTFFNNGAGNSTGADVLTVEYRYRIAENTRLRVGYTDFKYDNGNDVNLAQPLPPLPPDNHRDFKMVWTEIFGRF